MLVFAMEIDVGTGAGITIGASILFVVPGA
jgi:hypothetical protein